MKFEGQFYNGKPDEPTWFAEFLKHYSLVVRFLNQFNTSRFTMGADVNLNTGTSTARIRHGAESKIAHGMSITPSRVLVTGRVEGVYIRALNATDVYLTAKLISTGILPDYSGLSGNAVLVEDSTLFRIGDVVSLSGDLKTITGIDGNKVAFNSAVNRATLIRMVLNQDEVRLTIF